MKAFVMVTSKRSIELSAFDPTVIISSGLITFIHSCHVFVVGSDSKGAANFLSTTISLSSGHRCDALGITVGVHDHDDYSALPCTCTDFPGLRGSQIPHHFHQQRAHQSLPRGFQALRISSTDQPTPFCHFAILQILSCTHKSLHIFVRKFSKKCL